MFLIKVLATVIFTVLGYGVDSFFYYIAYAVIAYEILWAAGKNIIKGKFFDECFLMIIASGGAVFIREFTEGIAVLLLYTIGEFLSDLQAEKTKNGIKALVAMRPTSVLIMGKDDLGNDDALIEVPPESIEPGTTIYINAGEAVPIDGILLSKQCSLNLSSLTGESEEVEKYEDAEILSGSINLNGVIQVKTTKLYVDSTTSKIIKAVEDAEKNQGHTEKFITKFAKIYTPIVVLAAILLAVVPTLSGGDFNTWLYRSLTFLVVSCPCALVISVPLSYFAGIGALSKIGMLVRGGTVLDNIALAENIGFDKTNTLTDTNGIKSNAKNVMEQLAYLNPIMVSGDKKEIAEKIGGKIGNIKVYSECLPIDKLDLIKSKKNIIYVGDGLNDAPALTEASVGIAMGDVGTDIAAQSADAVIMNGNLATIPLAIKVSKKVRKIAKQNIWFAIGVKMFVLILASFGFVSMWLAVIADVGVSFLAVLNTLRINHRTAH
ncbi:MAG: HAD-IC family P-type ATPase [Ruminococcus sp.]|jgi:cation transport ATPase|nr:HAD-IC family P-type ATPase [Ruminococcus sp.]